MRLNKLNYNQQHRDILRISLISACWIASLWPLLVQMIDRWSIGDNNYCFLIFPLFLHLCLEQRKRLNFKELTWTPWGLIFALPAVLLIFAGTLSSVESLIYLGLWASIASLLINLYGKRVRFLLFALMILVFITPLPPFVNRMITFKLKLLASFMSAEMLRAAGVSVLLEGNILDLGIDKLQVVDACSGLRYLMSLILMALLVCHYFARQWWRNLLVIAMIVPLLLILNSLRIFSAGLFIANGHPEFNSSILHDLTGVLFFIGAGFIFFLIARSRQEGKPRPNNTYKTRRATTAHRHPAAWLITICLCLLFVASGFANSRFSSTPNHPPRDKFSVFPMVIGAWQGQRRYFSEEITKALWADDYVSAVFSKPGSRNNINVLISFYAYQVPRHTAHAPQSCLLGGGYYIAESSEHSVDISSTKKLNIKTMLLEKGEERVLASYFFLQRGRVFTSPWLNKFYLISDAITRHRTDGAIIRIEVALPPNQELTQAYKVLNSFTQQIWPLLPKYIPE